MLKFDQFGRPIDEDGNIISDGQTVSVPLMFMDGKPTGDTMTDEQKRDAYMQGIEDAGADSIKQPSTAYEHWLAGNDANGTMRDAAMAAGLSDYERWQKGLLDTTTPGPSTNRAGVGDAATIDELIQRTKAGA